MVGVCMDGWLQLWLGKLVDRLMDGLISGYVCRLVCVNWLVGGCNCGWLS